MKSPFKINWPLEWWVNELFIRMYTDNYVHHTFKYLIRLKTISRKNSKQNFLTCSVFTSFLQKMICLRRLRATVSMWRHLWRHKSKHKIMGIICQKFLNFKEFVKTFVRSSTYIRTFAFKADDPCFGAFRNSCAALHAFCDQRPLDLLCKIARAKNICSCRLANLCQAWKS